jgi:predicted MFS family arabinose efflux permease
MCLAFLLNVTAFPQMNALLPYVAKEVYHTDQTWLGYLVAGGASGALLGSLLLSRYGGTVRAGRHMVIFSIVWLATLLAFGHTQQPSTGIYVMFLAGLAQSLGQVPMAAMLLRTTEPRYRARVMGIRMLMIYGNLFGLLASGPVIANGSYALMATVYGTFGILAIVLITIRWRAELWHVEALANNR